MTKARTLADFISDGSPLADGTISVSEVSGAAPLASPTFTGNVTSETLKIVNGTSGELQLWGSAYNIQGGTNYGDMRFNAPRLRFYEDSSRIVEISGGSTYFFGSSIFNEDGADKDFRVESDANAHMLFVDAGNNNIILGGSGIGQAGTFGYNGASDDIRHIRPTSTAGDTLIAAVYGVSNGFQISDDASNNRTYKFHNVGAQSFFLGMTEAAFNETGTDRDFRVESDNQSHMLFVDAGNDAVGINTASPAEKLHVQGKMRLFDGGYPYLDIGTSTSNYFRLIHDNPTDRFYIGKNSNKSLVIDGSHNVIINEDSRNADFRVESDASGHMLFVDAGNNSVAINRSYGIAPLHVSGTASNTVSAANAFAKITDQGLDGLAIGSIQSSPFTAWLQSGYTANGYSPEMNNGYPLALNPLNANVVIGATNVADSSDGLSIISSSRDNLSIMYTGTDGAHASSINFRDKRGAVNARINNNLQDDGVGSAGAHLEFATAVSGAINERLVLGGTNQTEAVFNDPGFDYDFRVESDNATHMLYVDAGNDCVNIATTQTEAMFGGGQPSDGYVQQFTGSKLIKFRDFSGSASTPAQTVSTVININSYRAVTVRIISSGHYYNNGGSTYTRVNEFVFMCEGPTARINHRNDVFAQGTQIGNCGIPAAAMSGADQFTITQTIGAGYTNTTFIEVTGRGAVSIGNMTKA